jgi:hypothetical protein
MAKITVPKVTVTIFDRNIFTRNVFGNARITWKNEKVGSIVRRGAKGRFCSQSFVVAG